MRARRRPVSLIVSLSVLAVVVVGVGRLGVAAAGMGEPEPTASDAEVEQVYNPERGAYLPVDQNEALQDMEPHPAVDALTGGDPLPDQSDYVPETVGPELVPIDNINDTGVPSPFSASILVPTNAYRYSDEVVDKLVYAGADGEDRQTGMIFVTKEALADEEESGGAYLLPETGPVTLTGFSGDTLYFTGASGRTGTFDFESMAVTLDECLPQAASREQGPPRASRSTLKGG